jgi:putative transposase
VTRRLIDELQKKAVPVAQSCRVLGVSRSGFYEARQRAEKSAICKAGVHVHAAFAASGQSYGSRRVVAALANQGLKIGRYKVRNLMRREQLKPVWKRKFVHTTDSRHGLPVAPNVLARQFNPTAPNMAYASDITYIRTGAGWLYLAVALDLFSRKVVGWAMAPTMPATLVCDALRMAIQQRRPLPGLIVHSDRGSPLKSYAEIAPKVQHAYIKEELSGRLNMFFEEAQRWQLDAEDGKGYWAEVFGERCPFVEPCLLAQRKRGNVLDATPCFQY